MIEPSVIPQDIGEFLDYCPETGLFHWKVDRGSRVAAGDVAGSVTDEGYISVGLRGRNYMAHRVAWFITTGNQPPHLIDHKNTLRNDNRWVNLREATKAQNGQNCLPRGRFPKGVTLHKSGRYQAQIKAEGKNRYLGLFATPEAANAAYSAAAARFHGEFARAA